MATIGDTNKECNRVRVARIWIFLFNLINWQITCTHSFQLQHIHTLTEHNRCRFRSRAWSIPFCQRNTICIEEGSRLCIARSFIYEWSLFPVMWWKAGMGDWLLHQTHSRTTGINWHEMPLKNDAAISTTNHTFLNSHCALPKLSFTTFDHDIAHLPLVPSHTAHVYSKYLRSLKFCRKPLDPNS